MRCNKFRFLLIICVFLLVNVAWGNNLTITSIELNGRSSGEFEMGKSNKIEVEVKNNGNETLKDVEIKVTIEDIDDGDDLDEDSGEFDLKAGESEEETLKFKIDSDLDEEDYEVEVEVYVDGSKVLSSSETFDVDRKKHDLVIKKITFPDKVQCNYYPNLYVGVENRGEKDEDDVVVKISSLGLGITKQKTNLEIEDYSGDNSYLANFPLDLTGVSKGSYSFLVEVYRDNTNLESSKTVTFQIVDCGTQTTLKTQTQSQTVIDKQLKLIQASVVPVTTKTTATKFAESGLYFSLLVVLVGLMFVAVVLGVVLLVKR